MKRKSLLFLIFLVIFLAVGTTVFAQSSSSGGAQGRTPLATGLIAIGAGVAIGLTGLGTGIAQGRIGAAGVGSVAERPESFGTVLILIAIPETTIILGFIISVIVLFTL